MGIHYQQSSMFDSADHKVVQLDAQTDDVKEEGGGGADEMRRGPTR